MEVFSFFFFERKMRKRALEENCEGEREKKTKKKKYLSKAASKYLL